MNKQEIRERIWDTIEAEGIARFPFPPHDRIPNFAGADEAADRLAETPDWERAETIKANPDAPQLPVRRRALRAGKTVYAAQPRLRGEQPFLRLDPAEIADIDEATTVSGISEYGVAVGPEEVEGIDLIVSGSVAVTEAETRIGKGEGYSDLEFALLREFGHVGDETTVATTVHEVQIIESEMTADAHDVPMDLIVTSERVLRPEGQEKPAAIDREALSEERIEEIPALSRFRDG